MKYVGISGAQQTIDDINAVIGDYTKCLFESQPVCTDVSSTAAKLIDGTAGEAALHLYPNGMQLIVYPIVAQDIDKPAASSTGMDYSYDQTNNDGIEAVAMLYGSKGVEGKTKFTVGNAAFYAKLKFSIEDVSGTDDCAFGFCKVEAHAAAIDDKDEMACLNVISGNITIETILNGAATTSTDTTDDWGDTETHTLEVYVAIDGAVTYKIDGVAPTTTAAFSFDAAEVVMPFFYLLQASDLAGAVVFQDLEFGLQ